MKTEFLKSQTTDQDIEKEKYNYFAKLFYEWNKMRSAQRKAFLCCYAQVLLTQKMTRLMLNWIITTFSRVCKGGIDSSLGAQLSGDEVNYEKFIGRTSLLHLAYSITIVDIEDIEDNEESNKIIVERSRRILLSVLSRDDFNPKSFLDMTYYYAIMNSLSYDELERMLRKTAFLVIKHFFADIIDDNHVDIINNFFNEMSLSSIEGFLEFDDTSVAKIVPLLQMVDPSIDYEETKAIVDKKLEDMGVNYFNGNVLERNTNTYGYFKDTIEPMILIYSDRYLLPDEFCEFMVHERRSYENYFNIQSRTRSITLYGASFPLYPSRETDYAYLIVHTNCLNEKIKGYEGIGKNKWKETILKIKDHKEQINAIIEILEKVFEEISRYNGCKLNINRIREYRDNVDIKTLACAILLELLRPVEEKYAIEIVHKDSLAALNFPELETINNQSWKDQLRSIPDEKTRLSILSDKFNSVFERISPSKDSDSSEKPEKIKGAGSQTARKYASKDTDKEKLINAIAEELKTVKYPDKNNICTELQNTIAEELFDLDIDLNELFFETQCVEEKINSDFDFSDVKKYAREIVHFNSLADIGLPGYNGIGKIQWKNRMREIEDKEERIKRIEELLKKAFEEINRCWDNRKDDEISLEIIKDCMRWEVAELARAVNDELFREGVDVYSRSVSVDRAKYLYKFFKDCIEDNCDGGYFMEELSEVGENNDLVANRWAYFSVDRYQDAMLFMCLNSNNPISMFERINSMPGYGYYEN